MSKKGRGREVVLREFGPDDFQWFYPAEAAAKLAAVAEVCGFPFSRPPGKPLPKRDEPEILGRLVRTMFLEPPPERMAEAFARLPESDRMYFVHLVVTARAAALRLLDERPATLPGVPRDTLGTWSNLLSGSWFPMPDDWIICD